MDNNLVALLPMKAHSERVIGKNFKLLDHKPLYRWILDTLLSILEIDLIVVNTDAGELLKKDTIFKSEKILIRNRRPEICGDYVSMNLIIEDDINSIDAQTYIMTHTTNPFLSSSTIISALNKFKDAEKSKLCDSLFSVNKFQTRFYSKNGDAINHDPNNLIRTQDLEPYFEENSNLYIFTKESFQRSNSRIGQKPILFETPKLESQDLDTEEDWALAKALSSQFQ